MSTLRPTLGEWLGATLDLLPQGLAWSRDPDSNLGKLLGVAAEERRLRHDRAVVLLDVESYPPFSVELLADWEKAVGLPDPCRAAPGTLAERRSELVDRLFAPHVPTVELMVALAAQAGWEVEILERRSFVADVSVAGERIAESDFEWIVNVLGQSIDFFHAGQNVAGDPLWTFPDIATLECVLRRAAPAHTQVYFIVP